MKARRGVALAVIIGLVALLAPILISLRLAWIQGLNDEKLEGIRYATDTVRRGAETAGQFSRAIKILNHDNLPPCSPQEIELMQQLDVGSSYIQMVGRISGDTLLCTSLGSTVPRNVGPPTLITDGHVRERLDYVFGPNQLDHLDLVDREGIAILVDSQLLIDVDTESTGVNLAMTVPSNADHHGLISASGHFRPEWLQPIGRGEVKSFVDGQYIVSQVRASKLDMQGISVMPVHLAYRRVKHFAAIAVPIGCACGIVLALAVIYICRIRFSLSGFLRAAARNNDFFVEYQPVVDLASRRIVGAEALVRWQRGDAVISPASFIPLAEEIGIIALITRNVLDIVSRDLPKFLSIDPDFHVAVNLTATDLKASAIVDRLNDILHLNRASPRNLILEATEHGLISGPECLGTIAQLRSLGFRIAIDDFGTGYSSLGSLQELHLDLLKIDRAFVETIQGDGNTSEIILCIIDIARSLRFEMVAEGVETEIQATFLSQRGVTWAQGWLFGKPTHIDELCRRIEAERRVPHS